MTTIARIGPCRVCFCSQDRREPPHVHAERDAHTAKFWLEPVELASNIGFRPRELGDIRRLVLDHADEFLEAWRENFPAQARRAGRRPAR